MEKPVWERSYGGSAHRRRTVPCAPPHNRRTSAATRRTAAASITTFFRLLCPAVHVDAVTAILPAIRADTGASIELLPPVPGDSARIIQTHDALRLTALDRFPHYSPAQHALLLVVGRILHVSVQGLASGRWVTIRLLVPKANVGCLFGRGGRVMEKMRNDTNARIHVQDSGPHCVSADEEVIQVKGERSAVNKAVELITDLLKESLQHDHLRGHIHLPDLFFPPVDKFVSSPRRCSPSPVAVHPSYDPIVFRIICRDDKIHSIMDQSADGIGRLLREEVGVNVRVGDPVPSLDGHVIIITSHEGPAHELFPAQEALLHIQSICSNLGDKDNINTTEILVPSGWNGWLQGRNESLSEIRKSTGSNVRVLAKEILPAGVFEKDELIQIVGGITEARNALIQLTENLRSVLYQDVK